MLMMVGLLPACTTAEVKPPAPEPAPATQPAEPATPEPAAAPTRTLPDRVVPDGERPDDCTLEVANLEPRFASDQPGGSKVDVTRDATGIVESFVMSDGTPVRSEYGGCYHVGATETYRLAAPPADALTAAREVMSKVARTSPNDPLVQALAKATVVDASGLWECGEANTCDLHLDGTLLRISWSFAM